MNHHIVSKIQIGGCPSPRKSYRQPPAQTYGSPRYLVKGQVSPSQQKISSSHRIQQKQSPTKRQFIEVISPVKVMSPVKILENTSFYSLENSRASIRKRIQSRNQPFLDKSNITLTQSRSKPQIIKVSPSQFKIVGTTPKKVEHIVLKPNREAQLQRKVKFLEARVNQLHREKHQQMGKMNEQNRKIYHENTSLKLQISKLQKSLQSSYFQHQQSVTSKTVNEAQKFFQNSQGTDKWGQLQQKLAEQIAKNAQLAQKCCALESQLQEKDKLVEQINTKKQGFQNSLQKLTFQFESVLKKVEQIQAEKQQVQTQKLRFQKQIQIIKKQYQEATAQHQRDLQSMTNIIQQNNQKNSAIIQQYESKMQEYVNAYTQNEQVINELTNQLSVLENQKQIEKKVIHTIKEQKQQQDYKNIEQQCQLLQQNFKTAMQARESETFCHQTQIIELQTQLQTQIEEKSKLSELSVSQAEQIQLITVNLQQYHQKYVELQTKYQNLMVSYQQQRQNAARAQKSSGQKSKKCDELMKTIIRLNTHLNVKKTQ